MNRKLYALNFIKNVFVSVFTKNIFLKITALVITLLLWFMVIGSRNIEMIKKVPFTYITPPDLMVSNDVDTEVELRLLGPRAFLREVIEREDVITVDLRNKKQGFVSYKLYDDIIDLPIGVKVIGIYPDTIMPKLEKIKTAQVKVEPSFMGELASGYKIKKATIEPEVVEVSGPESVVSKTEKLFTEPIDLTNIIESGEKEVGLDPSLLRRFRNVSMKNFSVYIDIVPILVRKGFNNIRVYPFGAERYKINPEVITVYVEGPKLLIEQLTSKDIRVQVDLTFNAPGSHKEDVIIKLPANITLINANPKKVDVWIY
ncbi:MAG: hypothetical protein JXA66_06705 [Oligoflexia bacterium]|nr:hypothetical protein [Oligoflexia bacterium]